MITDVPSTRAELLNLVEKHYGHTQQGTVLLKVLSTMPDEQLEEYVLTRKADITSINDTLMMIADMRGKTMSSMFKADERAIDTLATTVSTLVKTAQVLRTSAGDHKNVIALEAAAAVMDAIYTSQVDYLRAKRLVMGVENNANRDNKRGNTTTGRLSKL